MEKYRKLIRRARRSVEYWTQLAIRDFVKDLSVRMGTVEMNRAQLAEKIGVSPAYVSKVMRGDVNFTLETMTKLAMATGGRIHVSVLPMPSDGKAKVVAKGSWHAALGLGTAAFEYLRDIDLEQAANDHWVSAKISVASISKCGGK